MGLFLARQCGWRKDRTAFGLGLPIFFIFCVCFLDWLRYPHLAISWKLSNSKHCSYIRGDVIMTQSSTILSLIHATFDLANCADIMGARELYYLLESDVPQTFALGSVLLPS